MAKILGLNKGKDAKENGKSGANSGNGEERKMSRHEPIENPQDFEAP